MSVYPKCDTARWGIAQEAESGYWQALRGHGAYKTPAAIKNTARVRYHNFLKRCALPVNYLDGKSVLEIGGGGNPFITAIVTDKDCVCIDPMYGTHVYNNFFHDKWVPKNCRLVRGVGESIPFPSNSFDYTISSNTIDHGFDPEAHIYEALRVSPRLILDLHIRRGNRYQPEHPCVFYSKKDVMVLIDKIGGKITKWAEARGSNFSCVVERTDRFVDKGRNMSIPEDIVRYLETPAEMPHEPIRSPQSEPGAPAVEIRDPAE